MDAVNLVVPFSDLRRRAREIMRALEERPVILTLRGRPKAVLVDYEAFNRMVKQHQALSEALDALLLEKAVETATGYRPLEDLLQQHKDLFGEQIAPEAE